MRTRAEYKTRIFRAIIADYPQSLPLYKVKMWNSTRTLTQTFHLSCLSSLLFFFSSRLALISLEFKCWLIACKVQKRLIDLSQ